VRLRKVDIGAADQPKGAVLQLESELGDHSCDGGRCIDDKILVPEYGMVLECARDGRNLGGLLAISEPGWPCGRTTSLFAQE
jgi:hypothetical protein